MNSRLPGIESSPRFRGSWFALLASVTVLFCSCRSLTPAVSPTELAHVPRRGGATVAPGSTEQQLPSPAGQLANASGANASGVEVVSGQTFNQAARRQFPVAQVGHTAPAATPRTTPAPVVPATSPAGTSKQVLPQHLRPTQPRPTSPLNWSVQQAANVAGGGYPSGIAGPAGGHSCAACRPHGGYPSLPTEPFNGGAWQNGPWPSDEYICNGGDNNLSVQVADDWSVIGIHEGDTIAHYDTLDGKVVVEPSNEVCLYAPRFASVRRVTGVVLHEQHLRSAGLEMPVHLAQSGEAESATTVLQPVQPSRNLAINSLNRFRDKMRPGGLENLQAAAGARHGFLPFEDFLIIRSGTFDNSEKARLTERLQAAYTWSHDTSVQVVVDNIDALEMSNEVGMQSVYTYEMPAGKPRLRLVKVASKQNAKPGEVVDFTVRFDNVGDRVIGNVTVIDNLNTRLEYVPDSQECTLKAEFSASDNEHESSVLRWEITEPMKVGSGGVIRFQCRVR